MLIITRAINDQMIRSLVKIRAQIGTRTLTSSKLLQQLSKHITHNVIGYDRIVAQSQGVLINCGRKLIEDGGQRFFVKFLSSFQKRDSLFHQVSLLVFSSLLSKTWIG